MARMTEEELTARADRIEKVRAAIVAHLGGPWVRKTNRTGGHGTITCPCCSGQVVFTRAASNGHIAARCSTAGCANWME